MDKGWNRVAISSLSCSTSTPTMYGNYRPPAYPQNRPGLGYQPAPARQHGNYPAVDFSRPPPGYTGPPGNQSYSPIPNQPSGSSAGAHTPVAAPVKNTQLSPQTTLFIGGIAPGINDQVLEQLLNVCTVFSFSFSYPALFFLSRMCFYKCLSLSLSFYVYFVGLWSVEKSEASERSDWETSSVWIRRVSSSLFCSFFLKCISERVFVSFQSIFVCFY